MSSFHLKSAHDNVKKNVGIPNYLTMVKKQKRNFFQ